MRSIASTLIACPFASADAAVLANKSFAYTGGDFVENKTAGDGFS
jgi:hypothetical protein